MELENVQIAERLRAVQDETAAVYSEAESLLAHMPRANLAVQKCATELSEAQDAFDEFEAVAAEMQHRLEVGAAHTQHLLGRVDLLPAHSPWAGAALEWEVQEMEQRHAILLRSCQEASRNAAADADKSNLRLMQGLALEEHEADVCSRLLEESKCGQSGVRDRWDDRIERLACELADAQMSGCARARDAELARSELATSRLEWLAERGELLRDADRWEEELTDVRACTDREEAEAERAARWQRSELQAARSAATRAATVQEAAAVARGRAEELAAEAREVADRRRAMRELLEEERGLAALLATRLAVEGLSSEAGMPEPLAKPLRCR